MMSFADSRFARFLRWLASSVCARRNLWIYPQVVLFVLSCIYAGRHLTVDMDRNRLIGPHNPAQQVYENIRREFPGEDADLVVVAQSENPERNRQYVERLGAKLQAETNLFKGVFYKGSLSTLGPHGLLLVPGKNLQDLLQTLRDYKPLAQEFARATNLDSLFGLINKQFRNPPAATNAAAIDSLIGAIPFLQRVVAQAEQSLLHPGPAPSPGVEALLGGGEEAAQKGYVTFANGQLYVLTVRPATRQMTKPAIVRLRELIRQIQYEAPGLNVGLTGERVLEYDEVRQSEKDTVLASIVAMFLCSFIFIAAYHEVGRPVKAALCLIIGLGFTMGFATASVGHLNVLSITFAPMLIGLAIDFGVHFISRYEEETRRGRTGTQAVFTATVFTGQGIVTGALTTAAAFLAMAFTHFKGVHEMGIIAGGGLLLCLVPMMTMLPILLLRGRENLLDRQLQQQGAGAGRRSRAEDILLAHPRLILIVTVLLCIGAALRFGKVYFDYNPLHLQSKGLSSVVFQEKLLRSAGRSLLFAEVVADSPEQAQGYAKKLAQLPSVAKVESVADYFVGDQSKKLELIRAIKKEVAGLHFAKMDPNPVRVDELGATLWALTGYLGLGAEFAARNRPALAGQMRTLRETLLEFRKTLQSGAPQIPEQLFKFQEALFDDMRGTFEAIKTQDTDHLLTPQELPPALRSRFIGVTGKFMLQVYPRKDIWQHENQREFIQQIKSVVPAGQVSGTPVNLYEYTTVLRRAYAEAACYALAVIIVMIFLHFQSGVCVALALAPVAIGAIWLLGFMGWFGIPFNVANIMILPLMVGIGVTNGIQVLNRFAEEQKPAVLSKSTGKAVLVSGLTAIAGFGSLMLGKHQGIRSLGIVMSFGIAACMVAGLTFLPALLEVLMERGWRLEIRRQNNAKAVNPVGKDPSRE